MRTANVLATAFRRTPVAFKKDVCIGGITESIYERSDYPVAKCQDILKNERITVLGYGPQGRGQSLNMKDQGFDVTIGLRKGGKSYDHAVADGFVPGKDLLSLEEAAEKGTVIQFLLSDAGQIQAWPTVKKYLHKGDMLYFSHGFGVVYHDQTGIVPPSDVDVALVAPKGSGLTVRDLFKAGKGINASWAVYQDATGNAAERTRALAFAIGSAHLFETDFLKEVSSDLTGERCVLMGMLQGAFLAQYEVLRERGHSPTEAYNETIEEALCSLYPLVEQKGMDWMYANCSTTAQRGALDWAPKFYKAIKPVVKDCYESVVTGNEAAISIKANSEPDYRVKLEKELAEIASQEMWEAGRQLRPLRPHL